MVAWATGTQGEQGVFGGWRQYAKEGGPFTYSYNLISPGMVDANAITRIKTRVNIGDFFEDKGNRNNFTAIANFTFSAADFTDNPGKVLTCSMFVVEASAFSPGVTPTPSQILALGVGVRVFRANGSDNNFGESPTTLSASTPGTYQFWVDGPEPEDLSDNTRYWVLVMPTAVTSMGSTPSVANDSPVGIVNTIGRGVSAWTNRTPLAPIITSPAPNTLVGPGSEVTLAFTPRDPDAFIVSPGDYDPRALRDLAGVQVQYAPRPTPSNPTPTWIDLPIATLDAIPVQGRGWFIIDADGTLPNDGGAALLDNLSIKIRCGSNTLRPGRAILPAGDWQIRMRTFDFGHPFSTVFYVGYVRGAGPLGSPGDIPSIDPSAGPFAATNYTPDTYPASDTSPWSDAVNISVSTQVPPPEPVSPKNSVPIIEGHSVTLNWLYKNTSVSLGKTSLTAGASGVTTSLAVNPTPADWPAGLKLRLSTGETVTLSAPASAGATVLDIVSTNLTHPVVSGNSVTALPYPQASRTIQMKKATDSVWTNVLVDDASSSPSWTVTGFDLTATTQYQWRVKVTDTYGLESQYSLVASFWVIPAPASGGVRPAPEDTIEGATLGCGKHRAFIFRRGGTERVGEIKNLTYLDWNRVRDDISTSKIVVSGWDVDCGNLLSILQCWAYEVVIFRETEFGAARVWEGPITLLTYTEKDVTIEAKDVMGYAYRRIIREKMSDAADGDTVVSRATRVLQSAFAPDDPNVLAYLTVIVHEDDAMEYRTTPAYARTAFEEVDDMAANAGLDYTTVGRSIVVWSTKHRTGTLPEFRDSDLGAAPIVSEYGMSMANRYAVSDGNGVWGEATRLDENGEDPIYGLVEMVSSSWASDSTEDTGTYTQEGLQTVIHSFEGFAERSIADRYMPGAPIVVRVPDNTTLNPSTVISIQQLVPGVVIPLRSTGTLRKVESNQKLDMVKVVDQGGNETISITLSPFNRDDGEDEGGEDA